MQQSHKGIIFIAVGEAYVKSANEAARSARAQSPSLLVDLFTDIPGAADQLFDSVHLIKNPHRRSKVDYLQESRFHHTLYLDTDLRVVNDITEMFSVLDRFDVALAHAHARNHEATNAVWRTPIPAAFPQLNGGVLLFRRSAPVLEFLREWRQSYHAAGFEKDQVTLRELLWLSDLRLHVLPPEYNVRYEKYLSVWENREAVAKILHFASFHQAANEMGE